MSVDVWEYTLRSIYGVFVQAARRAFLSTLKKTKTKDKTNVFPLWIHVELDCVYALFNTNFETFETLFFSVCVFCCKQIF